MRNLVLFLSLMLFAGCGHDGYEEIRMAERHFDESPERAVEICDSLEKETSLKTSASKSRFVLIKQLARHKEWREIELDSVFMEAVAYTNQKGSANEKLLANYLMGYAYSERNFHNDAQEAYLHAIEFADTTRTDCDFSRLAKAFAQMADSYKNRTHEVILEESVKKAKQFAELAGDSALVYDCMGVLANSLFNNCQYEKSNSIYKRLIPKYLEIGDTLCAKMLERQMALNFVCSNLLDSAAIYLKKFEDYCIKKESDGDSPMFYGYYSTKGLYYLKENKVDSAAYYFNKQYALNNNLQKLAAVERLLELYSEVGQIDSVKKYAKLYIEKRDEFDRVSNGNQMQVLHLRYNFDKLNSQLAQKSARMNFMLICILLLCLAVVILLYIIHSRKMKTAIEKEQLYSELADLKLKLVSKPKEETNWITQLKEAQQSGIYMELADNLAANPPQRMTNEQTMLLYKECFMFFLEQCELIRRKRLTPKECNICFLNLLDFKPNEIATLISSTKSSVSNSRNQLCKTLFNYPYKPSATKFDELLRNFPMEE